MTHGRGHTTPRHVGPRRRRNERCSCSNPMSRRDLLTCDDASCLARCHRAFVSNSCHFFRTPLSIPWRHIRLPREPEHDTQPVAASKRRQPLAVRDVVPTLQCRRWSCMSAGPRQAAQAQRDRGAAGRGTRPDRVATAWHVDTGFGSAAAICETWCARAVSRRERPGVGASPVGVAAIGATSTCGTADGFACAAAHCRLPRSWDRLSRVLPRSWDHLVASNGTTGRVVPGCPRRSGSSTRVGADRRAAGPVLSADVSVLGHRPGRCRVGRRCAGAGPDVRADCPPAVSRTGRGPERDSWEGKAMVGNMIRVLRARMTLLAVDEAGCRRWSTPLSWITPRSATDERSRNRRGR